MSGTRSTVWTGILVVALVVSAGGSALAVDASARPTAPTDTFAACASGQNGYEVTFTNVRIKTWRLIDVTAENVVVRHLEVRNLRTENGTARNATLENVTLRRLVVDNGTLSNVTAEELVVRNKSILSVPGANLLGEISDRTFERHVLKGVTITGLVIDSLVIENMTVEDRRLISNPSTRDIRSGGDLAENIDEESADIDMTSATIGEADIGNATGVDWNVENNSVEDETISNNSTSVGASRPVCAV